MDTQPTPIDLRDIVSRTGGDLYSGGKSALIPGPGHSPRDRSLSLTLTDDGRVLWKSWANDPPAKVWPYLGLPDTGGRQMNPREAERLRRERQAAQRADAARKLEFCRKVWADTQPAAGSIVETYLQGRGLLGPIPQAIRFHPAAPLSYPTAERPNPATAPSMVAIVTGPDGKSATGLHATALRPDGSGKASLNSPRRMFGELAGGVVQLTPLPASGELAVAEGIETALAYRTLTGTPTWAALSTSGLLRFAPPDGLRRLIVAADNDPSGLKAARELAERASRRCEVLVMPAPAETGSDWNNAIPGQAK